MEEVRDAVDTWIDVASTHTVGLRCPAVDPGDQDSPWSRPHEAVREPESIDPEDPWSEAVPPESMPVAQPEPESIKVKRATWVELADNFGYAGVWPETVTLEAQQFAEDAYPLVTYDVRALSLRRKLLDSALLPEENKASGSFCPAPPGAFHRWNALADAIYVAVGKAHWPPARTLLAWDPKRALLFVRQAPWASATIERTLDQFDEPHGPLPLRLWRRGDSEPLLEVDLPWRRPVRGMHGGSWSYLQDYEVEISNGPGLTNPILSSVETGVGLAAIWSASNGTGRPGDVLVEVCARPDAPRFERFHARLTSSYAGTSTCTIEIPRIEEKRWLGRMPAIAGTRQSVVLDNGFAGTLEIGEPRRSALRGWRRLPAGENPKPAKLSLQLSGTRSGTIGQAHVEIPASRERADAVLRSKSADWLTDPQRRATVTIDEYNEDALLPGRVVVEVTCASPSASGCMLADISIRLTAWNRLTRTVPVLPNTTEPKRERLVGLPMNHAFVTSRQVVLEANKESSLGFTADLGLGLERFTLRVRREVPSRR